MKRERLAEFNRLGIIQLCHSALDSRTLRSEILQRLRPMIPFDYAYFSATDPATSGAPAQATLPHIRIRQDFKDLLRSQRPLRYTVIGVRVEGQPDAGNPLGQHKGAGADRLKVTIPEEHLIRGTTVMRRHHPGAVSAKLDQVVRVKLFIIDNSG